MTDKYEQYHPLFKYELHQADLLRLFGAGIALMPRFKLYEAKRMTSLPVKKRKIQNKFKNGTFVEDGNLEVKSTGF